MLNVLKLFYLRRTTKFLRRYNQVNHGHSLGLQNVSQLQTLKKNIFHSTLKMSQPILLNL